MAVEIATCATITARTADPFDEPYCGIYALHAGLHALGVDANINDMVAPQVLSGENGSTASDLMRLADHYNVKGTFQERISIAELSAANAPCILHTSVAVSQTGFNHWILFLGMDGDFARIYDPPYGRYKIRSAELLSHWDGRGIFLAPHKSESVGLYVDCELLFAAVLVVIGMIVCRSSKLCNYPSLGLIGVSAIAAIVWHSTVEYGFFRNRYAIAAVASLYEQSELPEVTSDEVRIMSGDNNVTIVDARRPNAFDHSHVPNAINIPITITHGALRAQFAEIPPEHQVILYCENEQCRWADMIGSIFRAHGYRDVKVYREGFAGWENSTTSVLSQEFGSKPLGQFRWESSKIGLRNSSELPTQDTR